MVEFREIRYGDLETIRKWRTSEEITKFMYSSPQITPEGQIAWFESIQKDQSCNHKLITFKGIPVGVVSINNIEPTAKRCEWGIYIGELKYQSRGVGAIAAYKWFNYVFYELGFNKINSYILTDNIPSIQLNTAYGFQRTSYYTDHCFKDGKYHDMVGFELLRSQWDKLKEYYQRKLKL